MVLNPDKFLTWFLIQVFLTKQLFWTLVSADCIQGSRVHNVPFSQTIPGYKLVGPVMKSITAVDERACEEACFMAVPHTCYMFNYLKSKKHCELLYKDKPGKYELKKEVDWIFKTHKCLSDRCGQNGLCYSFSEPSQQNCSCKPGYNGTFCNEYSASIKTQEVKADYSSPVCVGAKDDKYGKFGAPKNGAIKTFRLVHLSGGVSAMTDNHSLANWGTNEGSDPKIELHVTDDLDNRVTPPVGYPILKTHLQMKYSLPGYGVFSPEIILPDIFPPLVVTRGKQFRVWFGQDFTNHYESNNAGTTCSDVYVVYTE